MIFALLLALQNDKAQANSRDDAWESAWVTHCRGIYTTTGKTPGMVLHIGDSITYSNAYGQWPRNGADKTNEDIAVLSWCMATSGSPTGTTPTDTNGLNLAAVDVPAGGVNRSMTAAGSIDSNEYLTGAANNGNAAMPSTSDTATARGYVADGVAYTRSLHITTVASAFSNAQFAVVMLGTNDFGRAAASFSNDLTGVVNALEARNIVVILSTIPPRTGGDVGPYNTAIRTLASTRGLPLIDYYEEILARRPGTTWQNTLIAADGVHPTGPNPSGNAYTPGGNAATHQTGTNATNDGYLLRGWLTVQKLKEVRSYVADGVNPPTTPPVSPPVTPPVVAGSSTRDNDNGCSGAVSTPALPWFVVLLALGFFVRRK